MTLVDFIIFYENLNRELENITLIKLELERRNYSVIVLNFNAISYFEAVKKYLPKVCVVPWLRGNQDVYIYTRFKKSSHKLVNLQWEQVTNNYYLKTGSMFPHDLAQQAYHVCWGKINYERLVSSGVAPDNLCITGAIHLDFCKDIFNDYYMERNEVAKIHGLDPRKKWVLFVSSFSFTTISNRKLNDFVETFGNIESFINMIDVSNVSKEELLSWFDKLLLDITDIEFIYRPHLIESKDEKLVQMNERHKHFHVLTTYSIKQWVKVCDSIHTWLSTSVAEITYMGKIYTILRPVQVSQEWEVETMHEAHKITKYNEFAESVKECKNIVDKNIAFPINNSLLEEHYDASDKPAYIRVSDFLESVYASGKAVEYSFNKQQLKSFQTYRRRTIITRLMAKIMRFLNVFNIRLSRFTTVERAFFKRCEEMHFDIGVTQNTLEKRLKKYL